MFRRKRTGLIGTAVVVGGAAHMGARSAQRSQEAAQQEAAAPAPQAVASPADDEAAQIEKFVP